MAGNGPPPSPTSRRQTGTQAHTWTDLPAEGFAGEIPAWPLPHESDLESAMWERYWRKPQAAAWAALGMADEIALYVRLYLEAGCGDGDGPSVKAAAEARQRAKQLGLTPDGMLHNRWRIARDELTEKRDEKPRESAGQSARKRLKAVDTDAVAEGLVSWRSSHAWLRRLASGSRRTVSSPIGSMVASRSC